MQASGGSKVSASGKSGSRSGGALAGIGGYTVLPLAETFPYNLYDVSQSLLTAVCTKL